MREAPVLNASGSTNYSMQAVSFKEPPEVLADDLPFRVVTVHLHEEELTGLDTR